MPSKSSGAYQTVIIQTERRHNLAWRGTSQSKRKGNITKSDHDVVAGEALNKSQNEPMSVPFDEENENVPDDEKMSRINTRVKNKQYNNVRNDVSRISMQQIDADMDERGVFALNYGKSNYPYREKLPEKQKSTISEEKTEAVGGADSHSNEDISNSLIRLTRAIISSSTSISSMPAMPPPTLKTAAEKHLWGAVQNIIEKTKDEYKAKLVQTEDATSRLNNTQHQLTELSQSLEAAEADVAKKSDELSELQNKYINLDVKFKAVKEKLDTQQYESDCAISTLQKLLNDATAKRDSTVDELQIQIDVLEDEKALLKEKMKTLSGENPFQNSDLSIIRSKALKASQLEKKIDILRKTLEKTEIEMNQIREENEKKDCVIASLEKNLNYSTFSVKRIITENNNKVSSHQDKVIDEKMTAVLQKELKAQSAALETAKNIIASLESANGELVAGLRGKLKGREEEVSALKSKLTQYNKENSKESCMAREQLECELEKSLDVLRSMIAIDEAISNENEEESNNLQQILSILTRCLNWFKNDKFVSGNVLNDGDNNKVTSYIETKCDTSITGEPDRITQANEEAAAKDLNQYVRDENAKMSKLKDALHLQKEETDRLRLENSKLLAEKEEQLEALRSKFSDSSNDDNKQEEDGLYTTPSMTSASSSSSASQKEVYCLRGDLKKAEKDIESARDELKIKEEALSNAKLIISSLEKSNKSMLEDLKLRLQESNTAIVSLLEKSSKQDDTCNILRVELKNCQKERRHEINKHNEEFSLLKDDAKKKEILLAAQDEELEILRKHLVHTAGEIAAKRTEIQPVDKATDVNE